MEGISSGERVGGSAIPVWSNGMGGRLRVLLLVAGVSLWGARAEAIPLLQLDMSGGVYDPVTESIVAPGGAFTLYALLTPPKNTTDAQLAALLSDTYYVSVAL